MVRGRFRDHRSGLLRTIVNASVAVTMLALTACGGGLHRSALRRPPASSTAVTTALSLPAGVSLVAVAAGPRIAIYAKPDEPAAEMTLANPWLLNNQPGKPVTQVFLVRDQRPGWVEVLLPVRPNGTTGWVRATDVRLQSDADSIDVSLSAHRIIVLAGDTTLYEGPVATGAPRTPTPPGRYYLRVLLKTTDPSSVYGPFAYGLSAHSDALTTFDGGDAEVGIHGNNDATVLGRSITHGCVRMDNAEIAKLAALLPLGTPVDIES